MNVANTYNIVYVLIITIIFTLKKSLQIFTKKTFIMSIDHAHMNINKVPFLLIDLLMT